MNTRHISVQRIPEIIHKSNVCCLDVNLNTFHISLVVFRQHKFRGLAL
jgi:hypothetical protein